jgi:hypothetical protein
MAKTKSSDDGKQRGPTRSKLERPGERSSPGSGEDERDAADIQPVDVENEGTPH